MFAPPRILEVVKSDQLGLGFLCVFAAGAATLVGASVVFFPRLVKLADRRILAASLGFAAGVMMYVSFLDIWAKGIGSFEEAGNEPAVAYLYTTLSFFGGAVVMMVSIFHFNIRIIATVEISVCVKKAVAHKQKKDLFLSDEY